MADPITPNQLPNLLGANNVDSNIFIVTSSDGLSAYKIQSSELQKALTSLTPRTSAGFTVYSYDSYTGINVNNYGFVGVSSINPSVSLDVYDNSAATNGSGQIRISALTSGRKVSFGLKDPNVYYQFAKKANDRNFYLEFSSNSGSSFSNLSAFDSSGNFSLSSKTGTLTDKFYVSGGQIKFESGNNAIIFDPNLTEIKTSATDETLLLNTNNIGDINIGSNVIYVDNSVTTPRIGIGHVNPSYLIHASGSGEMMRLQSNTSSSSLSFVDKVGASNITRYIGLDQNYFFINSSASSTGSFCFDTSNGYLGIKTGVPAYPIHVLSFDQTLANFSARYEDSGPKLVEIMVSANKAFNGGDTGPRVSMATFSRTVSTTPNTPRWSAGNLYGTFASSSWNDDFAIVRNGMLGASPIVSLTLDQNDNLDIRGSYTTQDAYCKGKFVEVYKTRLTGSGHIYVDPFGVDGSSSFASGNLDAISPFGVTAYAGKIERLMVMSSTTSSSITYPAYIEVYATTPTTTSVSGYTSIAATGGVVPPTLAGDVKAYGTFTFSSRQNIPQVVTLNGGASFSSGQLLQYRIYDLAKNSLNVPVTITSSISYTVV